MRKPGRPRKPPTPGTRVSLGLKVTAEIKERLDKAAISSGRTQSQEAEHRIERTFRDDEVLAAIAKMRIRPKVVHTTMWPTSDKGKQK